MLSSLAGLRRIVVPNQSRQLTSQLSTISKAQQEAKAATFNTKVGDDVVVYLHGMGPINYTLLALLHAADLKVVAGTTYTRQGLEKNGVKINFLENETGKENTFSVPPKDITVVSSLDEYRSVFGDTSPHLITVGTQQNTDIDKVMTFVGNDTRYLLTAQNGIHPWKGFLSKIDELNPLIKENLNVAGLSLFIQNSISDPENKPTEVDVKRWVKVGFGPVQPSDTSEKSATSGLMNYLLTYAGFRKSEIVNPWVVQIEKTMNNIMNVVPAILTQEKINELKVRSPGQVSVIPLPYESLTYPENKHWLDISLEAIKEVSRVYRDILPAQNTEDHYATVGFNYVDKSGHPPTTSTIAAVTDKNGNPLRKMEQLFNEIIEEGKLKKVPTPNVQLLAAVIDSHNATVDSFNASQR